MDKIVIPDDKVTIEHPGGSFQLDLVEAVCTIEEINAECQGLGVSDRLRRFGEWLHAKTGAQLPVGQLDWLMGQFQATYVKTKKHLVDSL